MTDKKRIPLTEEELQKLPGLNTRDISMNARLPQEKYPGFPVNYPTCSMPSGNNLGCDAFKKCDTPGEGPYHVPFINKRGTKTSCHCRHWMYRFKADRRNTPVDDPYLICSEFSKDANGQPKTEYYKILLENARNPYSVNRREDDTPEPQRDTSDRKGRTGPKGHDAPTG